MKVSEAALPTGKLGFRSGGVGGIVQTAGGVNA